jgi:hypothetical protein
MPPLRHLVLKATTTTAVQTETIRTTISTILIKEIRQLSQMLLWPINRVSRLLKMDKFQLTASTLTLTMLPTTSNTTPNNKPQVVRITTASKRLSITNSNSRLTMPKPKLKLRQRQPKAGTRRSQQTKKMHNNSNKRTTIITNSIINSTTTMEHKPPISSSTQGLNHQPVRNPQAKKNNSNLQLQTPKRRCEQN